MNTTCEQTRRALAASFDEGQVPYEELSPHLQTCAQCRAYAAELAALSDALRDLPQPELPAGLVARIHAKTHAQRSARRRKAALLSALAASVLVVLGGLLPATASYARALDTVNEWGAAAVALSPADIALPQPRDVLAQAFELAASVSDAIGVAASVAPPVLGTAANAFAAAAGCAFLVAFNGLMSQRLRTAGAVSSDRGNDR